MSGDKAPASALVASLEAEVRALKKEKFEVREKLRDIEFRLKTEGAEPSYASTPRHTLPPNCTN